MTRKWILMLTGLGHCLNCDLDDSLMVPARIQPITRITVQDGFGELNYVMSANIDESLVSQRLAGRRVGMIRKW